MDEIPLEILNILVLTVILYWVMRHGHYTFGPHRQIRLLLISGLLLLILGVVVGATDDNPELSKYRVLGPTVGRALVEHVVGFLGGMLCLSLGIYKWITSTVGTPVQSPNKRTSLISTDNDSREKIEHVIYNIATGVSAKTGDDFFRTLVEYLAKAINVEYALIGKLSQDGACIDTIAFYAHGAIVPNTSYPLKGTPCETVIAQTQRVYEKDLQRRFPQCEVLRALNAESYIGIPLNNSQHEAFGLISIVSEKPIENVEMSKAILQIFASRTAAELERSHAASNLQKQQLDLKLTLEATNVGTWSWGMVSNKVIWSKNVEAIFGLPRGAFKGTYDDYRALIYAEDLPHLEQAIAATLKEDVPYKVEHRIMFRDGSIHWMLGKGTLICNANGEPQRMYGIVYDITDRRNAEEMLRRSEAIMSNAQEITNIGSWEWDVKSNSVWWSDQTYKIFGYDKRTFTPTFDSYFKCVHPDDVHIINEATELLKSPSAQPQGFEYRIIRPDGSVRHVRDKAKIFRDERGNVMRVSGAVHDITEQVSVSTILLQSQSDLAHAQEIARLGSWSWDLQTGHVTWSDQMFKIYGLSKEEFLNNAWSIIDEFTHPDDRVRVRELTQHAIENDLPIEADCRLLLRDGTIKYVHGIGDIVKDADGVSIKRIGTVQDVTDLRKTEIALMESEKRFNLAVNGSTDGFWDWADVSKQEVWWTPRIYELLGYDDNEFPATFAKFEKLLHPDDRAHTIKAVNDHLQHNVPYDIEYRLRTKQDTYKWFRARGQAQRDNEGRPLRMSGSIHDIDIRKDAEQRMRESERKWRSITEHTPDHVMLLDLDFNIVYINHTVSDLTKEEVIGWPIVSFLPDEYQETVIETSRRVIQTGEPGSYDVVYEDKEGNLSYFEAVVGPIKDDEGAVTALTVNARDVTNRRRVEIALRALAHGSTAEEFDDFVRQCTRNAAKMYDAKYAFIGLLNPGGKSVHTLAVWAGEGFMDNFEYDLEGTPCQDILDLKIELIPANASKLYKDDKMLVDMGVDSYFGAPLIRSDNEMLGLISVMDTKPMKINPWTDPLLGVFAARLAIEYERKQAYDEINQHKQQLEEIVNIRTKEMEQQAKIIKQMHDALVAVDITGVVTSFNQGAVRLWGYEPKEVIGKHVSMLHPSYYVKQDLVDIIQGVEARGDSNLELDIKPKSGEIRNANLSLTIMRDDDGNPSGVIGFITDITARKRAEALLAQQTKELTAVNQELEAFCYSVSHDLRAPLRSIDGFSLALVEDYKDRLDEQALEYLSRVRGNAQRMAQLIDDLLRLSRVSRSAMNKDVVDLSALAEEIILNLRQLEPAREVDIKIQPGIEVSGDRILLRIVIDNLLGNAWKYTGKKTHASIEFGQTTVDNRTAYFVKDNGSGFSMKYVDKLFGAFQRLHGADEFEGTGIGLATVQRIIHRHGGEVWAVGEVNKGAAFYFSLPTDATGSGLFAINIDNKEYSTV